MRYELHVLALFVLYNHLNDHWGKEVSSGFWVNKYSVEIENRHSDNRYYVNGEIVWIKGKFKVVSF